MLVAAANSHLFQLLLDPQAPQLCGSSSGKMLLMETHSSHAKLHIPLKDYVPSGSLGEKESVTLLA